MRNKLLDPRLRGDDELISGSLAMSFPRIVLTRSLIFCKVRSQANQTDIFKYPMV